MVRGSGRSSAVNPGDLRPGQLRRALQLSAVSVAWSGAVGLVAAAVALSTHAVSLLGFGVDAVIDAVASIALIWRFRIEVRDPGRAAVVEIAAERVVGLALTALGVYLVYGAIAALLTQTHAEPSWVATVILVSSVVVLPGLARAKYVVSRRLESPALRLDAILTAVAALLALVSLASRVASETIGLGWADAAAALVVAAIILREGAASLRASGSVK